MCKIVEKKRVVYSLRKLLSFPPFVDAVSVTVTAQFKMDSSRSRGSFLGGGRE
jgi:hypothetical protein